MSATPIGALETMAVRGARVRFLDRHLARLSRTCEALGLESPDTASLRAAIEREARDAGDAGDDLLLRLAVDVDGSFTTSRRARRPLPERIAVWLDPQELDPGPAARHKTTDRARYAHLQRRAAEAGAFEGIFRGKGDRWLEGATTNLFVVQGGLLRTAGLDEGALDGVVRARVLALARSLGIDVLEEAPRGAAAPSMEEAFLTGAGVGVLPISTLLGLDLTLPTPGPLAEALAAAFDGDPE